MFKTAHEDYVAKAPPPPRPIDKQFLPSSSPSPGSHDIRDQFTKKPGSISSMASAAASARTVNDPPNFLPNRSTNIIRNNPLGTLYKSSNSFNDKDGIVDLTGPDSSSHGVDFAEDDFSDDDHLDLDFQAPSALPQLPRSKPGLPKSMAPPLSSGDAGTEIPWSSSPASHFQRPTARATPASKLKRESSAPNAAAADQPRPEPKRRKRLDMWKQEKAEEDDPQYSFTAQQATPVTKSKSYDPSASAIREARQKWKTNQKPDAKAADHQEMSLNEMAEIVNQHAKKRPDAFNLSQEQEHVRKLVVDKKQSVFFTGPAGTGKSVLMRAIIKDLKKKYMRDPERVAVTASTGLAACNIGGVTLHSFSGLSWSSRTQWL